MLPTRSKPSSRRAMFALAGLLALVVIAAGSFLTGSLAQGCLPSVQNPIVCENLLPGAPASEWDVSGQGDPSIQGFATDISVNTGETVRFKIDTTAASYHIDIYRVGHYGGMGARKVATIPASQTTPRNQDNCLTQPTTGLVDCGNWTVSASWNVPADAVSGVYIARPVRTDNGGASHIMFVVRDDDGGSDLLFQTSDTTWQAYNQYGGNSLYVGSPAGRAYKVSYNRPFTTRGNAPEDWFFNAEYPMIRWLEQNGYDVSYFTGVDSDRRGAEIREHKVFLSVGHDEYWSGGQRANVEAARNASPPVHLAFFSGNEIFWKTRWESSIDGTATAHRTLVCYKETHADARIDPTGIWTGTWRDPRFSPPADGGRPENALSGTIFTVNSGTSAIQIPSAEGKHRFWRNTTVANLAPGTTATMPAGTLGYEWDENLDNGARPSGLMRLSLRTVANVEKLQDYGSTYANGTATHSMTLYRHSSGALVFGAGTIQYAWGLDSNHDRGSAASDVRMRQATLNLFADMGVEALTRQGDLAPATASTDTVAPTTSITSPPSGASIPVGSNVAISGTATESGGGILTSVEVSVDGGATWKPASGLANWTFSWTASGNGPVTLMSRAWDDSGNVESPGASVTVTVTGGGSCPCSSIWSSSTVPPGADADNSAVEVGTKFRATINGYIVGVRFYKFAANTGTHVGNLWTSTGTRLATVTFTNETASGWQQAMFPAPVAITANTTYITSYHAPAGRYAVQSNYWAAPVVNPPLRGLQNGEDGPNGVYAYGATSRFPTNTFNSENYWVDTLFVASLEPDTTPPTMSTTTPANLATGVAANANITATFSEDMDVATIAASTFELRDASNALVPAAVTYDAGTRTAALDPSANLNLGATYTATVRGGAADPRAKDVAGNALAQNHVWTFTTSTTPPPQFGCPCSIWANTTLPDRQDSDSQSVEIGVKFRSSVAGFITGLRFYKYPTNSGTHVGSLWTSTGTKLASVTFTNETANGWQTMALSSPVAIAANTTYIASYHANAGRYAVSSAYFASTGVTRGPLTAPRDGQFGGQGVYAYGSGSIFPTNTFNSENYWVDVVFTTSTGPDTTPPAVVATTPPPGRSGVKVSSAISATFDEPINPSTVNTTTVELRTPTDSVVPATVSYDGISRVATLTPSAPLAYSTVYRATLKGGTVDPRIKDEAGNALVTNHSWTFTTSAPPPPPPGEGTGGPILVIASAANPFSRYFAEILRNEGFNAFEVEDVGLVDAAMLSGYDVVILGEMALADAQVTMFTSWVTAGGNLIAMRPDKKLAGLLGLTDAGSTLSNAYLLMNTATAPAAGLVAETIQFHGTADRYTATGATVIATLYSTATAATTNPAVTVRSVGTNGGQAAAFTFDLARSVVYTRQGNPAWSGQERDGIAPIRSDDLFYGARAGDVQPDWVNLAKVAIPQADEQQRLLGQLILDMNADRKPLPRFWYLPRMLKATIVMTGDDHATGGTAGRFEQHKGFSPANCSVADWECVRSTSYIYPNTPLGNPAAAAYEADGFEVALHVETACANYTAANLNSFYVNQLAQFQTAFPNVAAPVTNRMHCIAWSDYDTQPQVEVNHGIRLNTSYYYYPSSWVANRPGMFTGSGWPMRFTRANGEIIDSYQATTQMTDESGQSYPSTVDTLLDRALGPLGYYGVFTANMHTDQVTVPGSDEIVLSALARGVPVVSARQMLEWLDGRNGSSFTDIAWGGNILSFRIQVGAGAGGLHAMVPATTPFGALTGVHRDGTAVPHSLQTIKGIEYAVFPGQAGAYQVAYGVDATPPVISSVSAAPSAGTATISWLTNETSDSRVDYGTTSGALTQNVANAALVTSHSMTLSGLAPNTTYYYRVRSADGLGNATVAPPAADAPLSFNTPAPSLSIANASATEGNAASTPLTFAVTLAPSSSQTVTVNYSPADVTAAAGADYVSQTGTVTFDPGQTTKNVTIAVNGDLLDEQDETLLVTLSSPTNATIAQAQATGTIIDDDAAPSISVNDVVVTEGNAGTVNASFTATLSAASGRTVTVNYATANGTATTPGDYVTTSGTLTFAPGATTQAINVAVVGETMDEPDETLLLNLTSPTNATIARSQGTATVTDDDAAPSVGIANAARAEGNSGSATLSFAVALSAASGRVVTVDYATSNGTAQAGADYTAAAGTLVFPAGTTTQLVNVPILGDTVSEPHETFLVTLANSTNATISVAQATGTIQNDDGVPSVTIVDVSVTEGNGGTVNAVFALTLTPASTENVTVDFATANGTATAGSDFVAASGIVTFSPGVTSASITVTVNGDTTVEPTETFVVNLTNPANATLARTQATGTITTDDGVPGLVAAYNFDEASGATVLDRSGTGLNGTITGATRTAAGHAGGALTFNGAGNWVTVADNAALDVTRMTLSAWVRPTTLSGWRTVVMKESSSGLAYALYAHDNAPRPAVWIDTGTDGTANGTAALPTNAWTHLAATFDGTAMRLYVNGALVRTVNRTGNLILTTGPLRIGGNGPWGEYFAGVIDDVRVYNRALTQAEIQGDMNTPVP